MSELYYSTFVSLQRHFKSDYDYTKYQGKNIKYNKKNYLKYENVCHVLAQRYRKFDDFKWLCISNLLLNSGYWITNLLSVQAKETYQSKLKIIHGLSYYFEQDLLLILNCGDLNSCLNFHENEFPAVYHMIRKSEINLESFLVLDRLLGIIEKWQKKTDDFIFQEYMKEWNKYKVFVDINNEIKYKEIVKKHCL